MAQNRKNNSRFKSYEGRKEKDKHIRLTSDMMNDNRFKTLSLSAKALYSYMKLWACGKKEFDYSISLSKDIMSPNTFLKSRDELIDKGFIEFINGYAARDKKETSKFCFSDKWIKMIN